MTSRGFNEADFERVADIVDRAVAITSTIDKQARSAAEEQGVKNPGSVRAFLNHVGDGTAILEIGALREEVAAWVGEFPGPWTVPP
jgi:glycine hydroxymethyltransferase